MRRNDFFEKIFNPFYISTYRNLRLKKNANARKIARGGAIMKARRCFQVHKSTSQKSQATRNEGQEDEMLWEMQLCEADKSAALLREKRSCGR